MTNSELKEAVAERFAKEGIWINSSLPLRDLCLKAEEFTGHRRQGRQTQYEYLLIFAGLKREYSPVKWTPPFRPLRAMAHPRLTEIDRAQPPMMTPNGVGNGAERQHGYGRGQ